ncbi:MAG: sigma-E factor negative regulatory protein [Burkholderiaceae bacterium]
MTKQTAKDETVTVAVERISALLDGELDRSQAEAMIGAICADASMKQAWRELHLVGDALRSHEVAACDADGFCARVAAALASEPTVLAPRAARPSSLRRYWIPGMAVAASVAAVGFIAVPLLRAPDTTTIAKSATPPAIEVAADASAKDLPTIANARGLGSSYSPYLAAHRELSGPSVVPRAAVYLRSNEDR